MVEFMGYIKMLIEERGLAHYNNSYDTDIVVRGNQDTALEFECNGSSVTYWWFHSHTNDAISHCDELDLSDPESINTIVHWLDKLRAIPTTS